MIELIWILYLPASLVLLWHAASIDRDGLDRWMCWLLAVTVMLFGTGRMMFWFDPAMLPQFRWIFDTAHVAMLVFAFLWVWRKRRETCPLLK